MIANILFYLFSTIGLILGYNYYIKQKNINRFPPAESHRHKIMSSSLLRGWYAFLSPYFVDGKPVFRDRLNMALDCLNRGEEVFLEYGLSGKCVFNVVDTLAVKQIMNNIDLFHRTYPVANESLRFLVGRESILSVHDNERWKIMRQAFTPVFSKNRVFFEPLVPLSQKVVDIMSQFNSPDNTSNMRDILALFTLDSLGVCVLGENFNLLDGHESTPVADFNFVWNNYSIIQALFPSYVKIPTELNKKRVESMNGFNNYIFDMLKKHDIKEDPENLLDVLIAENHKNPDVFTEQVVRDNVALFFFAGHETTASLLVGILAHLAKYQSVQDTLREEISQMESFTYDVVNNMKYLQCVINETGRLYPPLAYLNRRRASQDVVIGGYHVPKGTEITCHVLANHYNEKIYPDPLKWNPERFLNPNREQKNSLRFFGDGPKHCIGKHFSILEQKLFLIELLSKYRVHMTDDSEIRFSRSLVQKVDEKKVRFYLEPL